MTKKQIIKSIATAGVSQKYLQELQKMTLEEVRKEYKEFGQSMKD